VTISNGKVKKTISRFSYFLRVFVEKCQCLEIHYLRFHSIRHKVQYDTSWGKNDLHYLTLKKSSIETFSFQTGHFCWLLLYIPKVLVSWVFLKNICRSKSPKHDLVASQKIPNFNSKKKLLKQANKHGRKGVVNEHGKKKYFCFKFETAFGCLSAAILFLFLGFGGCGLSLWQHGADLVRNLLVLGLDLFQDGVDSGLIVKVNLKKVLC
jgi:hypothetical protein